MFFKWNVEPKKIGPINKQFGSQIDAIENVNYKSSSPNPIFLE